MEDTKTAASATNQHLDSEKPKAQHATESLHSNVSQSHAPSTTADSNVQVSNINAKLANPLEGIPRDQLRREAELWAEGNGLGEWKDLIGRGAGLAGDPLGFDTMDELSEEEKTSLRKERTNRWWQTTDMYKMVILCSIGAVVQGMDEAVINGANLYFASQFGIDPGSSNNGGGSSKNQWLLGLVNSAPYLCCAVIGCWCTYPLNKFFGRRGAIFITATISWLTCFWQGVTNSWPHLFAARFVLGFGIGPKSATVPVYSAECAPAPIRGALVMMWQMWTAFGIALGYSADLAFHGVRDSSNITGLNWRLMLGSAGVPAIVVMAQVWTCPESPRWLMNKGRYLDAFKSLKRLRQSDIMAARDLYYIHITLKNEQELTRNRNLVKELFTVPRNRRAVYASGIVMFMQQFCGVNAIAYYSSSVFLESGFTKPKALLASWGFGMQNWLFAFPAVWTIDTFGRRNLLLFTFPLMSIFLLLTGLGFLIPESSRNARVGVVALGIYLFATVYSPGEGPVPFTYSAEAFPLYVRELGMSYATALTWFFNFVVAITFPPLIGAFTPTGAFGWYAAWNIVGWWMILFFVPETKALTLEELDQVFSVPTKKHASHQFKMLSYFWRKYILRKQNVKKEQLYHFQSDEYAGIEDADNNMKRQKYTPPSEKV
ncbi:hypothetical protein BT69DRAFT_1322488 [Atractiella rhizophila]|nr:hypothetical protein BT69DRAFT_1322488 [Atractiella rhizophila]